MLQGYKHNTSTDDIILPQRSYKNSPKEGWVSSESLKEFQLQLRVNFKFALPVLTMGSMLGWFVWPFFSGHLCWRQPPIYCMCIKWYLDSLLLYASPLSDAGSHSHQTKMHQFPVRCFSACHLGVQCLTQSLHKCNPKSKMAEHAHFSILCWLHLLLVFVNLQQHLFINWSDCRLTDPTEGLTSLH